jgi:hypothetical protein
LGSVYRQSTTRGPHAFGSEKRADMKHSLRNVFGTGARVQNASVDSHSVLQLLPELA